MARPARRPDPYTLTAREQQIQDLREQGLGPTNIAHALGMTIGNVQKTITRIKKVLLDRELQADRERRMG